MVCTTEAHPSCSRKSRGLSSSSASCLGINWLTDNSQYKSDGWHWMQLKKKAAKLSIITNSAHLPEALGRTHRPPKVETGTFNRKAQFWLTCQHSLRNVFHETKRKHLPSLFYQGSKPESLRKTQGIKTLPIKGFCLLWFFAFMKRQLLGTCCGLSQWRQCHD